MNDKKVRFAIIGADFTLRALMAMWYPKDLGELAAICDWNPEMLEKFRKDYGAEYPDVRLVRSFDEVLAMDDVDAVFVMVRDQYHEEMAVAALEAGKAVYLEKPMALSIEGCDRILEAAVRNKGRLFVGHNMRYVDSILKMKEVIDSGAIGQVQSVWVRHFVNYGSCYFRHWCGCQATCNGLLLQKGAHDIDIVHWLAGGYGTRVVGMGRLSVYNRNTGRRIDYGGGEKADRHASFDDACWPPLEIDGLRRDIDVEDHNMILFQLDNGVQCSYEHCMYAPDAERNYTFIGDRGRVENIGDFGNSQIHVWTRRGPRRDPDIVYPVRPPAGSHGGADPKILRAFFEYVAHGVRPAVSPIAARNAVAVGVLGHYSARHGNVPMDIPPVPEHIRQFFGEA
ncbi:MAG: Gfo/Idh/MocA family oxidoreductase [Kiritimatiellae bacterium]|nr:Gfo/Idh/MocA family oxidoreductase [Kiritimatiellia bacterium]